jgi:carbon monoxide dehydrogenase subunit G
MELVNEFRVAVPIDQAWNVLTDLERIAPCMPGAELTAVDGDVFEGGVKVKVGPITARYKGKASFQEKDDVAHRAVIKAEGRETRGQGNANAIITAQLTEDGDGTKAVVTTDLTISGKAAQFGRGVLADVSGKLLQQFVRCLESNVLSADVPAAASPPAVADGDPAPVEAAALAAAAEAAESTLVPEQESAAPTTTTVPSQDSAPAAEQASAPPATAPAAVPSPAGPRIINQTSKVQAEPVNLIGTVAGPIAKRLVPVLAVLLVAFLVLRRRAKS